MKYYSIEGRVYSLSITKQRELDRLFPEKDTENHSEWLQWIEDNGKFIFNCENLAY